MSDKPLSNTLPPQDRVEPQNASPVGGNEQTQDLNRLRNKGKGVSLWQDAWRRLKKNKMAMIGMVVVGLYVIISLSAPILPIHSYRFQILEHQYLPPSLTKTAGELVVEQQVDRFLRTNESMGGEGLTEAQETELAELRERMATETAMIDGEEVLVHSRRYVLGTDNL
ncbi:MAG: hypothetical protein ACOC2N_05335, partial [Spirochaetota bacterium]